MFLSKAAQIALALVFLLMGVYGGDLPLGLLCASLLSAPVINPPSAGAAGRRLTAALRRITSPPATKNRRRLAVRAYGWTGSVLAALALTLAARGTTSPLLAGSISAYVALWVLAMAVTVTARLTQRRSAQR